MCPLHLRLHFCQCRRWQIHPLHRRLVPIIATPYLRCAGEWIKRLAPFLLTVLWSRRSPWLFEWKMWGSMGHGVYPKSAEGTLRCCPGLLNVIQKVHLSTNKESVKCRWMNRMSGYLFSLPHVAYIRSPLWFPSSLSMGFTSEWYEEEWGFVSQACAGRNAAEGYRMSFKSPSLHQKMMAGWKCWTTLLFCFTLFTSI